MSKISKKPEIVAMSSTHLDEIKLRISETRLADDDKKIILSILTTYQWLYGQLQHAKFSMHRLKKIFGFKTETRFSSIKKKDTTVDTLNLDGLNQDPQLSDLEPGELVPSTKKS